MTRTRGSKASIADYFHKFNSVRISIKLLHVRFDNMINFHRFECHIDTYNKKYVSQAFIS